MTPATETVGEETRRPRSGDRNRPSGRPLQPSPPRGSCCSAQLLFFVMYFIILGLIDWAILGFSNMQPNIAGWILLGLSPIFAMLPPMVIMYLIFALGLLVMIKASGPQAKDEVPTGQEDLAAGDDTGPGNVEVLPHPDEENARREE